MPLHRAGGQGRLTDLRQIIFSCFVDRIVPDSAEIMELNINLVLLQGFLQAHLSINDTR